MLGEEIFLLAVLLSVHTLNGKKEIAEIIPKVALSTLSDSDAIELELTSRDVKDRLKRLNISCLKLKEKLETKKRNFKGFTSPIL